MMFPEGLYWHTIPLYFGLCLFLLPLLILVWVHYKHQRLWRSFADPHLLHWIKHQPGKNTQSRSKLILLALAWLMFCVALSGPRTIKWLPPSLQQDTTYIQVLVDFSQSMRAVDSTRSRIEQAQSLLQNWTEQLPEHTKLGISIYAGKAHTLLIPTQDKNLLHYFIQQLAQLQPPVNGNNLAAAVKSANRILADAPDKAYLLILSDGDMDNPHFEQALTVLKQSTQPQQAQRDLVVIGLGGDEAVPIPVKANQSLSDNGKVIVSRRHANKLTALALSMGGKYYPVETLDMTSDLKGLLSLPEPRIPDKDSHKVQWHEWFFVPLLLGIIFLLSALKFRYPTIKNSLTVSIYVSLVFFLGACDNSTLKNNIGRENKSYNAFSLEGKLAQALERHQYKQVLSLINDSNPKKLTSYTHFVQGVACYRLKDYICAQQNFAWVAWNEPDTQIRAKAVFNLANTHFYLGDYEQALVLYHDAQQQGIAVDKVRINIEFARVLSEAIQQTIADIDKTRQRAQWRSATSRLTEKFTDKLADGIFLPAFKSLRTNPLFKQLPMQQQQKLLAQGIRFKTYKGRDQVLAQQNAWVLSRQDKNSDTTAQLYNQLMAYEIGLHYVPDKALEEEGQRPW